MTVVDGPADDGFGAGIIVAVVRAAGVTVGATLVGAAGDELRVAGAEADAEGGLVRLPVAGVYVPYGVPAGAGATEVPTPAAADVAPVVEPLKPPLAAILPTIAINKAMTANTSTAVALAPLE